MLSIREPLEHIGSRGKIAHIWALVCALVSDPKLVWALVSAQKPYERLYLLKNLYVCSNVQPNSYVRLYVRSYVRSYGPLYVLPNLYGRFYVLLFFFFLFFFKIFIDWYDRVVV